MEISALLNKMVIFIVLMLIGYFMARHGVFDAGFTRAANNLILNVFMVGTILNSMISTGAERNLSEILEIICLTSVTMVLGYVFGFILTKLIRVEDEHAACYELLIAVSNSIFIALPIAEAVYGNYAVFIVSVSCIPFNLLLYSYGVWRLKDNGERSIRIRDIFCIPLIATLAGLVLILLHIPVPQAIRGVFSALSGATMPMSMIVIGIMLSSVSLLDAFKKPKFALLSAIRLILIPVLTWMVCRMLTNDTVLLMTCMLIAAAPCGVIVTVLTIQYGRDGVFTSEAVQHSTICSMVTIPILIQVFSRFS